MDLYQSKEQISAGEAAYNYLIQKHPVSQQLPPLSTDSSFWKHHVEPLLKSLKDIFKGMFPRFHFDLPSMPEELISATYYIALGILIICVCIALWKICVPIVKHFSIPRARESDIRASEIQLKLEAQIEQACILKQFKKAMRLRWLLFLERCAFSFSATPGEVPLDALRDNESLNPQTQYHFMFGHGMVTSDTIQNYDLLLKALEAGFLKAPNESV